MPEALIVSAAARKSSHDSGGSTPASSKAATLYQTSDLLAALKRKPYSVSSTVPSWTADSPRFVSTSSRAKSIGCRASCSAKSRTSPGCGSRAMSGGLPPSTAVESWVGNWSPAEV